MVDDLYSQNRETKDKNNGAYPRAPHWFEFNRINDLPNDWTFRVIKWNDNPEDDDIVDRGEAEVVRGNHRFVITTFLHPKERTHDRYWSVAYETINQDGELEPLSFHIGTNQAIARNNLGHARDILDGDETEPHILVRDYKNKSLRETFEFPTKHMAGSAADLQTKLKMDTEDGNYFISLYSKNEWDEELKREKELNEI